MTATTPPEVSPSETGTAAATSAPAGMIGPENARGESNEPQSGRRQGGRVGRALRALRIGRSLTPSRPFRLRLGMALTCLPVLAFATAVRLGVERNESAVRTVGTDATRGITVAQALKLNLAELDEVVVRSLLNEAPLTQNGFPDEYNTKRAELHDSLILAAQASSSGAAYTQPLANIDYALPHYHDLVHDAVTAGAAGNQGSALQTYAEAHDVMAGTLLPEAEFVDKANSYVLNNAYDGQRARSASTVRLIVMSWLALVVFLGLAQILVARRFQRIVNPGLALATVVALVFGAFALQRLDASKADLASAREQAFQSVHVLARARAAVVSARQAEGQVLLDPTTADAARADFAGQVSRLLRMDGEDVGELAREGTIPEQAAGYLARVAGPGATGSEPESARQMVIAFGAFLAEDTEMQRLVDTEERGAAVERYAGGQAYADLGAAITAQQEAEQESFDEAAEAAKDAVEPLNELNALAAVGILGLALLGLFQRLREYRA